ncbi:MAG: hypothetical protein Q7R73_01350 [bacterium]|nr:hypothetical protein [bacterium]
MNEQTLKFIRSAKKIAIVIADEASGDQIGAALGLLNSLNAAGKKAEFFFTNELPPQFLFLAPYFPEEEPDAESADSLRDFVISLDAKKHGIEEIRYEKNGDTLSIILGARQGVSSADIAIEAADDYDLIVSFGIPKREKFLTKAGTNASGMARTPILLLAREDIKEHDAGAVLADISKSSWCELVWDLLVAANNKKEIAEAAATPLLAGLFAATNNLRSPDTTVASAEFASLLVKHGAKRELIREHLEPPKETSLHLMQLWGRALSRSRMDEETNILWSFLPAEDFLKTGSTSKDLPHVFSQMEHAVSSPRGFLYVFENPHKNHIRAILKSKDNMLLARAAEYEAGDLSSDALILHKSFTSFAGAEEHLRTLLAKVL